MVDIIQRCFKRATIWIIILKLLLQESSTTHLYKSRLKINTSISKCTPSATIFKSNICMEITFVMAEVGSSRVGDNTLSRRHQTALHPGRTEADLALHRTPRRFAYCFSVRRSFVVGRRRKHRETIVGRRRTGIELRIGGRRKRDSLRFEVTLQRNGHDGGIRRRRGLGLDRRRTRGKRCDFLVVFFFLFDWGVIACGISSLRCHWTARRFWWGASQGRFS